MVQKPVGKLLSLKDVQSLSPSADGIVHVDGGIVGPGGKWWIDAEGNAHFAGEMTVLKDIDPDFIQLTNQTSAPAGISNRSLWVNSQTLKYRNQSGTDVTISLGTTPTPPTIVSDITNTADPGSSISTTETTKATLNITPSITGASIYLSAYWTGTDEDVTFGAGNVPTVKLKRGTTVLSTYSSFTANTGGDNSFFSGGLFYVDSPATTSSTTYNLTFQAVSGAINALLHVSLVAFECFPAVG